MAIKSKCSSCGRFVANGESCCGNIKKVEIKRRKPEEIDATQAKSLAEAIFGPKGELIEEDVEDDESEESEEEE